MSNWQANLGVQPGIIRNNGWQPIETAPKDGTAFVGYLVFAVVDGIPQWEAGCASWENGRFRFRDPKRGPPTHWMPPPATQQ